MTKTIIYMRHAEYHRSFGANSGTLTERGNEMALDMGLFMYSREFNPDVCIFSNAIRAKETKDLVLQAYQDKDDYDFSKLIQFEEKSINETWDLDPIVDVIALFPEAKCILIVGHNPAIGAIAGILTSSTSVFTPGSFIAVEYSSEITNATICNRHECKVVLEERAFYL